MKKPKLKIGDRVWYADTELRDVEAGGFIVHRHDRTDHRRIWIRYPTMNIGMPVATAAVFLTKADAIECVAKFCDKRAAEYDARAAELRAMGNGEGEKSHG